MQQWMWLEGAAAHGEPLTSCSLWRPCWNSMLLQDGPYHVDPCWSSAWRAAASRVPTWDQFTKDGTPWEEHHAEVGAESDYKGVSETKHYGLTVACIPHSPVAP